MPDTCARERIVESQEQDAGYRRRAGLEVVEGFRDTERRLWAADRQYALPALHLQCGQPHQLRHRAPGRLLPRQAVLERVGEGIQVRQQERAAAGRDADTTDAR